MTADPSRPVPTAATAAPDRVAWLPYLGLGLAAAALGAITSIGVWLFKQAFNALHHLTFNTLGGALQPIGAWTIALIPAIGGIGVALIMKIGTIVNQLSPGLQLDPIAFAMVATAAMLAGTFQAPLFGAMMMLEMTDHYGMLVPV